MKLTYDGDFGHTRIVETGATADHTVNPLGISYFGMRANFEHAQAEQTAWREEAYNAPMAYLGFKHSLASWEAQGRPK